MNQNELVFFSIVFCYNAAFRFDTFLQILFFSKHSALFGPNKNGF